MGEQEFFQPLTKEDKVTVVLYRIGIVCSTAIISFIAVLAYKGSSPLYPMSLSGTSSIMLLLLLYISVGFCVFFIHLYVGSYHRFLKKIFYVSLLCLAGLFIIGKGNPVVPLLRTPPYSAMLLIPLSLCIGFVTAKEAVCFRLFEGYIIAMIMPAYLFVYSLGVLDHKGAAFILAFIALMLLFFMLRKVFMPIHYDIGDKSAYQP